MILVDDPGSGSLVGGTCIGMFNTVNKKYYFDIIPLSLYNSENIPKKLYLDHVIKIFNDGIKQIDGSKRHKIRICQGYMFDKLREWLEKNNYNWDSDVISGRLQYLVENTFNQYALSLGLPEYFIKYAKYPFHFHKLLRWVYADYKNRVKLCKTGWNSFKKYGRLNISSFTDSLFSERNFYCLKCSQIIKTPSKVRVIKYVTNAPNTIYLHYKCEY